MRDPSLRLSDLRFLGAWLLPLLTLVGVLVSPATAALGAIVVWWAVTMVDACWPGAQRSPVSAGPAPALLWVLRLYVPLQLAMLAGGLWAAARADWLTVAGLAFAVGFVNGSQGITYAHELGHSKSRLDRVLGWVLMASVNYGHFMVEHYRGHHVRVATRADPASASRGESLWRFLPRTLTGSFLDAWRLERQRLQQHRRSWLASPLAWACALNVAVVALLAATGAGKLLAFWLGQSIVAIWLLETVNYIEHYGLRRAVGSDGRREPFAMVHAWNADHVVSNSLLANLQRHSDHHLHAMKPYPELRALPGPQLPTGYSGCLLLAAIPPLWFALMHHRLDALEAAARSSPAPITAPMTAPATAHVTAS